MCMDEMVEKKKFSVEDFFFVYSLYHFFLVKSCSNVVDLNKFNLV
ncbi:conserved hypothetical protein [Listeria innocua FSL J1-023]|nr:conserved hypothetical protein [Listeria innocua FSL J1-023]